MTNVKYDDCLGTLAEQIAEWGVGLIIGAGFSKAVIGDSPNPAKNWKELFIEVVDYLKYSDFKDEEESFIDVNKCLSAGNTLPQIATQICQLLSQKRGVTYDESKDEVKKIVRSLVNWIPEIEVAKKYANLFEKLDVNWIITTNYDEVLESILGDKSYTLDPDQALTAPSNMIPIYHIHGSRRHYKNLVVTHEDYVPLFRPGNYRETKLSTIMAEAPILILGYSLSDLNLLSALEQSKRSFTNRVPFSVVLTSYVSNDEDQLKCRRRNFEVGGYDELEINSVQQFLKKLVDEVNVQRQKIRNQQIEQEKAYKPFQQLVSEVEQMTGKSDFTQDYMGFSYLYHSDLKGLQEFSILENPKPYIKQLKSKVPSIVPYQQITFNKSIAIIMQFIKGESRENGNFSAYADLLDFIFYLFDNFELKQFTPRIMELITLNLDYCLVYADGSMGSSWQANKLWNNKGPKFYYDHRDLWDEIYLQANIKLSKTDSETSSLINHFDQIMNSNNYIDTF